MNVYLVTGGAGFIGSNYISTLIENKKNKIIVIDKLSYAGNIANIKNFINKKNFHFIKTNIGNSKNIIDILNKHRPNYIVNFAAESHVDTSITFPNRFLINNVKHSVSFLNVVLNYWKKIKINKNKFKFIQVSTDEVYGSLSKKEKPFTEKSTIKPGNPYSASKAAFDHFVLSYFNTYGMPNIITRCSNNFGQNQNIEKLIPKCINNIYLNKKIPIYGNGNQIRDWLHVLDHCNAINIVIQSGKNGEIYNIGNNTEITNINLVKNICKIFDNIKDNNKYNHSTLISFVKDRLGHDLRYSINSSKIRKELKWKPQKNFNKELENTVKFYLNRN
jgi:dTDP-glucose 4,6-dehydratase